MFRNAITCRISLPSYMSHIRRRRFSSSGPSVPPPSDQESALATAIKSSCIGVVAGSFGSLVGMGGGFVMIPMMTGYLRLSQHQAHGTSLAAVMATGLAGATAYYYGGGEVDFPTAAFIAIGGSVTSRFGANLTKSIDSNTLKRMLGGFMLMVAPIVPLRKQIMEKITSIKEEKQEGDKPAAWDLQHVLKLTGIGTFSGFLAGLFGVGGGVITVPLVAMATDFSHYKALGTSLCAMVLPAASGTLTHFRQGNVRPRVALPLSLGAAVGSFVVGKEVALFIPEEVLQWGFSATMLILGGRTFASAGSLFRKK